MIFEASDVYADFVENNDIEEIVNIYNSNKKFLINHTDKDAVSYEWIREELESMKEIDFCSSKIVDKASCKIIGIMDFKIDEETYLSLLMLHSDYRKKGLGNIIYSAFEKYARSFGSKHIRIDVVTSYDKDVLDFWMSNGFFWVKDIELNWTGKVLPAVIMKKNI